MAHLTDLFTEAVSPTLLTSHTADSGGTWSLGYSGGSGVSPKIYNNAGLGLNGVVVAGESGASMWKYSDVSPTVDMIVRAVLYFASPGNVYSVGFAARMSADGTTGYLLAYVTQNATFRLYRFSGAGNPVLVTGGMSSPLSVPLDVGMQPEWVWTITNVSGAVHHNFKMGGTTILDLDDTDSARVTAAGYTEQWFNMLAADSGAYFDSIRTTPAAASAVTLTGPSSGTVGVASTNFTVGLNGPPSGTVVVTPNDASGGGTFSPTSLSLTSGSPTGTFTYTPGSTGAKTIGVTNNASLTNPSSITYTAAAASTPGTINIDLFRTWLSAAPRPALSVPRVTFQRLSDGVQVLNLANQTTNGSGNLPVTNSALVQGTDYMVDAWNADGTVHAQKKFTAV